MNAGRFALHLMRYGELITLSRPSTGQNISIYAAKSVDVKQEILKAEARQADVEVRVSADSFDVPILTPKIGDRLIFSDHEYAISMIREMRSLGGALFGYVLLCRG